MAADGTVSSSLGGGGWVVDGVTPEDEPPWLGVGVVGTGFVGFVGFAGFVGFVDVVGRLATGGCGVAWMLLLVPVADEFTRAGLPVAGAGVDAGGEAACR